MSTDTTVNYFDSTMSGAPSLSNTAGSLISVLDACLVNGFGSVTLDSLVIASNVATATVSTGHHFAMVGNVGPVIKIEGATPAELNVEFRIQSMADVNTFTFATSGIADQTATGTISAKRSCAGFSKAFSGTNKAVYRSDDVTGTRLYCRIDDGYTTYSRIRGYEAMDDVDTGTGLFPTDAQISGGGYVYKATGSPRPWALYTDGRIVYFLCDTSNNAAWYGGFVFGDIDSYVAGDAFGCAIMFGNSSAGTLSLYALNSTNTSYLARSYTQLGGSLLSARYSHGKSSLLGNAGQVYPALADNCLHLWPIECWEGTTIARGMVPGLWNPLHAGDVPHGLIVDDIPNLPGRTLKVQATGSSVYKSAIDLTGPWR